MAPVEPALPRLLVVAGHDPSGAGIDADRAALADLSVGARFVVSAWTEQDGGGLRSLGARGVEAWLPEARRELPVAALKFGLLPGREDVRAAAALVREARTARERAGCQLWAVVDPVLASSSGGRFLDREAAREYLDSLLPAGVVLTPNLDELAELADVDRNLLARDLSAREQCARKLLDLGAAAIVVKGGHGEENPACDLVLSGPGPAIRLEHARIAGGKVRGSGCRFASRLAARLTLGSSLAQAVSEASEHVLGRIREAGKRPPAAGLAFAGEEDILPRPRCR
jgi:hydroxymethylpyrimidine/phosphomethylpyrimidine kinase